MSLGKTATMKSVRPKKGGRPATGRDPLVQVRVPKSMLDRIDRWAGGFHEMDRSAALRCLLYLGLKRSRPATVIDPKGSRTHHSNQKGLKTTHASLSQPARTGRHLVLINGAAS